MALSGKNIGRYHIVAQLGKGGMAVVYRAFDTRLEREVAIKFIRIGLIGEELMAGVLKRFEREAKALARLRHPAIVSIHDFGDYDDSPYLVMDYLPGGTLKQFTGSPIPYQKAASFLAPVAFGLEFAHGRGVIHRDVKPSNILITEDGDPMLTDFGIAKILEDKDTMHLTSTGMGVGTPEYMAPEQWQGEFSPATDIYSLGVVFYELITGHRPYTADTPAAVAIKQVTDPLLRPQQFASGIPDAVEWTLFKALAREPDERHETMEEFAAELEQFTGGETQIKAETSGKFAAVDALVKAAGRLLDSGNLDGALENFNQALDLCPEESGRADEIRTMITFLTTDKSPPIGIPTPSVDLPKTDTSTKDEHTDDDQDAKTTDEQKVVSSKRKRHKKKAKRTKRSKSKISLWRILLGTMMLVFILFAGVMVVDIVLSPPAATVTPTEVTAVADDPKPSQEGSSVDQTPEASTTEAPAVCEDGVEACGERWMNEFGCFSCHTVGGESLVGPTLQGLAGGMVELEDGSTTVVDDDYLREAIIHPNAMVHGAFDTNVMPQDFGGTIPEEKLLEIIAFIKNQE